MTVNSAGHSGGIVLAGLSPHPPIVIPQVGRGEEAKVASTFSALNELGEAFSEKNPDTLILITPHGPVFSDVISVRYTPKVYGDLSNFGASSVEVEFETDLQLVEEIEREAQAEGDLTVLLLNDRNLYRYSIERELDHGAVVPLHFLKSHGLASRLVVINIGFLTYLELYRFGVAVERAVRRLGRKVAVLASGDLSHRLTKEAPAGYNPRGREFDEEIVSKLGKFDVSGVFSMSHSLIEEAGECGMRPITILLGALDRYRVKPRILSYEGTFGVGYSVALFEILGSGESRLPALLDAQMKAVSQMRANESFAVSLARNTVETYIKTGRLPKRPSHRDIPEEFRAKGGAFVSIHKQGTLRGCIGTTEGTKSDLVDEIMSNAVSAATQDPRFSPIREEELAYLDYSVDVLSPAESVCDLSELDPKKYGVIVEKGARRGLLLPDLPGVDSATEQIRIAREKAGIASAESGVRLYRFTVTRYH